MADVVLAPVAPLAPNRAAVGEPVARLPVVRGERILDAVARRDGAAALAIVFILKNSTRPAVNLTAVSWDCIVLADTIQYRYLLNPVAIYYILDGSNTNITRAAIPAGPRS